ncbi:MAG TPA: non-ribosomal peptide synthetase [Bryobacteraceae bacterium]|nr:non-ribosomal peptide synthetase [Bryobacteraceae bacterium]
MVAGEGRDNSSQTVYSRLRAASQDSSATALLGIGRKPMTYHGLLQQVERTVEFLNSIAIGRGDKVAVVLRNGPDAAACCLSVASGAVSALLNPAYTAAEFESYLGDLKPKAVLIEENSKSACVAVAQELRMPVIWHIPDPQGPAGSFCLQGGVKQQTARPGFAEPDDVALMVHTSGSTSRPKMAPLSHRNVCSGAMNNVVQLGLTAQDRCLCITNMFFTQAILVSVFSSLAAGGSVVCTPGYDPASFFEWLDEFHPTWYSAPTTLQRSILAHAARHPESVARARLRVIRCSSSSASPDFIAKMEELFRAPMLDSYGLTETSSTIVGERLPPASRKRGSVGVAVGCEIAIMDEHGAWLAPGEVGEVVVRGPSVISGYDCAPEINQASFRNGWLRTGDLGVLDADGFLFLTGRSKEIINRGGVKISPAEIDEILNAHPAVAEATAFAVPHEVLGEEVGAAIVLSDGWAGSEQLEAELREFCAARLSSFKVPRRIVFLADMPRSATGKTLRIGMAERLGLAATASKPAAKPASKPELKMDSPAADLDAPVGCQDGRSPRGIVEMVLLHIWEEELGRRPISVRDDFFDLGGDSLLGVRLLARVEATFGKNLGLASLFEVPTVERMASLLSESPSEGYAFGSSKIIAIRASGSLPPLFILGPQPLFRPLILKLPENLPVFGLSFPDGASLPTPFRLEDIAAVQVEALRRFQPEGPYALMGWCADGVLAYEMARQLRAQGQEVSLVAMIDAFNPARWSYESRWSWRRDRFRFHYANFSNLGAKAAIAYSRERFQTLRKRTRQLLWRALYRVHLRTERRISLALRLPEQILTLSVSQYLPVPYQGCAMVVRAESRPAGTHADAAYGWRGLAGDLHVVDVPGNHRDIFVAPNVEVMASAIAAALSAADRSRQLRV